jgi:DNA-binding SARP family transcriptional activator
VTVDVDDFLRTAGEGLQLARKGDPTAGEQLAAAEAAYTGDFLEENLYEDWAAPLREEARALYIDVARTLAEIAVSEADLDAAARLFLRVLERDPYDERAHLALVSTLEGSGRHGEARRAYRAYSARMEEIAVEASPFPAAQTA